MIQMSTLVAIILIAATTYLTRILGYVLLKNRWCFKKYAEKKQVGF